MSKLHEGVLVTDANSRGALSVIRSLGRRKVKTVLLAQDGLALSFFSRYCSESVYCPSSRDDLDGFTKTLLRIVKSRRYATLFPLGDDSLLPISEHRDKLTPYVKLALPSHDSVLTALNKARTLRAANEAGIHTPQTFHVKDIAEVKDLSTRIQYPAVIKSKWSYVWKQNGKAQHTRPFYVKSASELRSTYVKVDENFPKPMIQEYVPGHNISVALLFDHGEPKAACCIRVYRAMPITGGQSVLRESIPPDSTLLRCASDLLRSLQWHGVAEVEFRVDSRDLTPKLMEINARFWGSMDVAIESGIDFPYLLFLLAEGEQITPVFSYKTGVKFRWLNGDFQNLRSLLRGEQRLINTTPPNKLHAILRFIKFYEKNMHYDSLSLSDPLPFFMTGTVQVMIRRAKRIVDM